MAELRQHSQESKSLEPIHERTIELVDEARATGRSVELVAQALHELQGELSQLRKSFQEPKAKSAEIAEMVLEVQTQLSGIVRQLQEQDRKIEHAEVEIKSQLLDPKGRNSRVLGVALTFLVLLNLGATALLFLRP